MTREKALKILKEEKRSFECLEKVARNKTTREHFKEKVQAYDFTIKQLEASPPKVVINEFLGSEKIWQIRVKVDDELIPNENIDFISDRNSKENGQVFRKKKGFKNIIQRWLKKGSKCNG